MPRQNEIKEPLDKMTSEELYIVMCEKAYPFLPQEEKPPQKRVICGDLNYVVYSQEELQEILEGDWVSQLMRLYEFTNGAVETLDYWGQFQSWEQLWLAFIMYENRDMIWEGENWVNDKR